MHKGEKGKDPQRVPRGELVGAGALSQPRGKGDRAGGIASTQGTAPAPGPWPALGERGSVTSTKQSLAGKRERTKALKRVHEDVTFPLGGEGEGGRKNKSGTSWK